MAITGFEEIENINTAIFDTLIQADSELLKYSQNYDTIESGIVNTPMLQVYWQGFNTGDATDRATFGAGLRLTDFVFNVDLYLDQLAFHNQSLIQTYTIMNRVHTVLVAQRRKPYFGLDTIKSYHYRADRSLFEYGQIEGSTKQFPGVRFTLDIRVF